MQRIARLYVHVPGYDSGILEHAGQHVFAYDHAVLGVPDAAISLTMPVRLPSYQSTPMLPALQTFMPEGFIADRIGERFGKTIKMNDMALLALSAGDSIGRLRVSVERDIRPQTGAVQLKELLADQGNRDLFADLCERYLLGSAVAGVQPKVLLNAERIDAEHSRGGDNEKMSLVDRATVRAAQYIVKAGDGEFPDLAANEFHCLSIAKNAGLEVPEFWLSEDQKRLVVERFDRRDGAVLGFEDMVSLQGKQNADKYDGSIESVAKAIRLNASAAHVQSSLAALFASVALSVMLRNGDAHLKNFGLLYTSPTSSDCRLSPVYDIVTTTLYLPRDRMALSLARERGWPTDEILLKFARYVCAVSSPDAALARIAEAITDYAPTQAEPTWHRQKQALAPQFRNSRAI
jgi:serine/threonine-protein kinase HipA